MIQLLQNRYAALRKDLRKKLRPHVSKLNALPARKRAIAIGGAFVLLFALGDVVIFSPNGEKRDALKKQIDDIGKMNATLEKEQQQILDNQNFDPDAALKADMSQMQARIEKLDKELAGFTVDLISPTQMAKLLEDMLNRETDLILEKLETLPAEPVVKSLSTKGSKKKSGRYFQHAVVMELRGTYFSTLHYLELLEDLPWDFYWDDLHFQTLSYPEARITMRLHTLSAQIGWIGV